MKRVPCCRQCGDRTGRRASPAYGRQFCTKNCAAQWAVWNADDLTEQEWNPNTDEWETKSYDEDLGLCYWLCDSDEFRRKYYEDWAKPVDNAEELARKAEEEGKDW